ncbi:MAG: 2-hydroxychromene-2-carboxylate isomerase [Myxococcales bacterium]|nr:2-hydroxychromene-2-carboxylate isomerase [Myxococcales bacterium]
MRCQMNESRCRSMTSLARYSATAPSLMPSAFAQAAGSIRWSRNGSSIGGAAYTAGSWHSRAVGIAARLLGTVVSAALSDTGLRARRAWFRQKRVNERIAVEFFHDVADPYSHLVVQAVAPFLGAAGVDFAMTLVSRPDREAVPEPSLLRAYSLRDSHELCRRHDLEFPAGARMPSRPSIELAETILAERRPLEETLSLAREVGDALFGGDGIDRLAMRAGRSSVERARRMLEEGAARRRALGHYLGGALHCEGEWYVGIDRLPALQAHLHGEGVEVALARSRVPPRALPVDEERGDTLEFFFSFRSPYSYLALDRVAELARHHNKPLRLRPVMPIAMRGARISPAKKLYIVLDAAREARRLGVPFGNVCDPLGPGVANAMALFAWAEREGCELALTRSFMRGIWSEARSVDDEDELKIMVERAGLSWHRAEAHLTDDGWCARVQENRDALYALGLWGVPSFKLGGFSAWGQDRIDYVAERLARDGRG